MEDIDSSPGYRRASQPRAAVSLTDLRTPIVDNFLSMLPMGHEKALKYAFYNVIAMIVAAGIVLAFWGVYCILEPFIKALLWATLCGSVLHPFKEHLCSLARLWLRNVNKSPVPFSVRIISSPLVVADSISDKIGTYIWKYWKSILIAIVTFFVTYVIYYNPPVTLAAFLQYFASILWSLLWWTLSWINGVTVTALNVIFVSAVIHVVLSEQRTAKLKAEETSEDKSPTEVPDSPSRSQPQPQPILESKHLLRLSYVAWAATIAYICLRLPYTLVVGLAVIVIIGTFVYVKQQRERSFQYTLPRISRMAAMMVLNIGNDNNKNVPRRRRQTIAPSFLDGMNSTALGGGSVVSGVGGAKVITERTPLHRSLSEGPRLSTLHSSDLDQHEEEQATSFKMPSPIHHPSSPGTEDEVDGHAVDSNKFLYGVFCACMVVFVWNRLWLMHLIPIPIVYYGVKKLSSRFKLPATISEKVIKPLNQAYHELDTEGSILIPEPVKVIFRILHAGDRKLISFCEPYIDPVASLLVVVLVVMATILGLIFAATQVYAEGDHLVRVTRNLINTTVSQHPELNQLLPEGWQSMMNSMVGNAFQYGREYLANVIRDSMSDSNPEKAEQIEIQVIELWDRIYMAWNQTWENAFTNVTHKRRENQEGIEWNDLLETGKEVPNLLELSVLTDYARANVGTLWSIMDALWKILIGNISLAISALYSILSLLFGGGHAILNLIINLVVFFTALFYLLSASTSVYKPVELFNQLSPGTGVHTNRFALAFEEAVNGVFVASFKMAAFYGMWTWLIHTLFQVNIVFVPSIFGGLFAAVPFLMPYWAALPAVLELWLIQGHWPKALCMLLAQMAPMSAVDTQIYSEIKGGGHPYLTGLAVAGGIFYFGVQGAIMGPVILCLVFVAVKVGNSFLWEGNEAELLTESKPRWNRRQRTFGDQMDGSGDSSALQQDSSMISSS